MSNKGFTHVIAILIIGALLLIGFLLYQNVINVEVFDDSYIQSSPAPQTPISNSETANWNVYTNVTYNYQLKYPADWKANSVEPGPGEVPLNQTSRGLVVYPKQYNSTATAKTYIQIETDGNWNLSAPSAQEWINPQREVFYTVTDRSNITYKNSPAAVIIGTYDGYGFPATISTTFLTSQDKKTYYSITVVAAKDESEQVVNQIASSFEFLNQESQSSEGKMCGGIAGIICPEGYTCVLNGNYPDASGKCTKAEEKTN